MANTLFASQCRVCDGPLDASAAVPVCNACLASAATAHAGPQCPVCGESLPPDSPAALAHQFRPDEAPLLCETCSEHPRAFARATAHGDYAGTLRELIHLFKYNGVRSLAQPLGACAASAFIARSGDMPHEVVVTAVPLFAAKQRGRGFNQAREIAHEVAKQLRRAGWKVREEHGLLSRIRNTRSQSELNPRQRRANLRGAFIAGPQADAARGQTVLLVDDILTTGTTAHLCARQLRLSGATEVYVATIARSQPIQTAQWGRDSPADELSNLWCGVDAAPQTFTPAHANMQQ